jgi:hypothetical protein
MQWRRCSLTIKFHSQRAIFDRSSDAVRIPAIVNNKLIILAIAHDAIKKVLLVGDGPADYLVDTYRRFRHAFHILAIHKYSANLVQADGTVVIEARDFAALDAPDSYNSNRSIN